MQQITKKEIEQAAIKCFKWPTNKYGEDVTLPPAQTYPHGFRKFCDVFEKGFNAGIEHQSVQLTIQSGKVMSLEANELDLFEIKKWVWDWHVQKELQGCGSGMDFDDIFHAIRDYASQFKSRISELEAENDTFLNRISELEIEKHQLSQALNSIHDMCLNTPAKKQTKTTVNILVMARQGIQPTDTRTE